jgi:transcriptional regulator with XRE-family HTH domain
MPRHYVAMLIDARRILGVSQGELGERLGASRRTGQRWEAGRAKPGPTELGRLAALVHAEDPKLAAEIATVGGSSLESLGLVKPTRPAPAAPPPPAPPAEHVVDAVVCAAAEAIGVMPDAVRPALRAAFRRARLVGLDVATVERALGPGPEAGAGLQPKRSGPKPDA